MQDDTDWLEERHFRLVGHWLGGQPKMQRLTKLERTQGVYAFVVDQKIKYIGKATSLRSRIREYNRAFRPLTDRGFRNVHDMMLDASIDSRRIDVWVLDNLDGGSPSAAALEAIWIREKQPVWNLAGVERPHRKGSPTEL